MLFQNRCRRKVANVICSYIWYSMDEMQKELNPSAENEVEADMIIYATFYFIIKDVMARYKLEPHMYNVLTGAVLRMAGGDRNVQRKALAFYLAHLEYLTKTYRRITSGEDLQTLSFDSFSLAYDSDPDEPFGLSEVVFAEALTKVCSFAIDITSKSKLKA